jgi:N-acetyltransferase
MLTVSRPRDASSAAPPPCPPTAPLPASTLVQDEASEDGTCSAASAPPGCTQQLPPRRTVQLHLDLGQKAFDSVRCPLCGMLYCPGDASDERLHAAQCARVGSEGSALVWPMHARDDVVWGPGEEGVRIVRVPPVPAPSLSSCAKLELPGLQARPSAVASHLLKVLGPHSLPKAPAALLGAPPLLLHYFVAVGVGGGVLGALCAHALSPPLARLVCREEEGGKHSGSGGSGGGAGGGNPASSPLTMRHDAQEVQAVLGVDQIWVAPSGRRKGVAKALLNAARAHTIHAFSVPREQVAFSQPTGDGFQFAAAYRGTPGIVPVFEDAREEGE